MKKAIFILFAAIFILISLVIVGIWRFIIFTHKDIPLDITIETDIKIRKLDWDKIAKYGEEIRVFALNEAESEVYRTQDLGWKVIVFCCKFSNGSSKEFRGVQLYYAEGQELPGFIFGKRLGAWARAENLNIKRFQRDVPYTFAILIKDEGYSDEELIEKIMDVKLIIAEYATPVSEPFKIRDVIRE
ncbi:MAG: hypothetical protein FWG40_07120 [Peptococcaceae bacterium]|nr:hypothetical protein [Peptococcaceae bacterium]